jgi:integrase
MNTNSRKNNSANQNQSDRNSKKPSNGSGSPGATVTIPSRTQNILTVEQAAKLLRYAAKVGLQPLVALGLFAGLRLGEIMNLDWSDVNLAAKEILLRAPKRVYVVAINDTLVGWLRKHVQRKGRITRASKLNERLCYLKDQIGIRDVSLMQALRRTFGTYHLTVIQNPLVTARILRISLEYLRLWHPNRVSKKNAARFWSLRPPRTQARPLDERHLSQYKQRPVGPGLVRARVYRRNPWIADTEWMDGRRLRIMFATKAEAESCIRRQMTGRK